MNGVTMDVPANAVDGELTVTPVITTEDTPPAPAPAGGTIASKTVVISGVDYNFYEPVEITIQYDPAALGANDVPAVFFYDETTGTYSLVSVRSIDTTTHSLVFATTHGGKYVAIGISGLAEDLGIVGNVGTKGKGFLDVSADTGYSPAVDGFFHPNFGAYDSPGGSCLGMANFSVWYFNAAKSDNGNTGLYTMYKEGDAARWEDDLTARELISRSFMASSQAWAKAWMQKNYELNAQLTGYLMIVGLKLSGPMTFLMADQWPGMLSGHATVVYKFEAGQFYVYDVNFPGESTTIDWGYDAGSSEFKFTNYKKNAAYNPQFTQFSFEGFATYAELSQYKLLFDGAQSGWDVSKFNTLTVTSAKDSENNDLTITADETIQLTEQDTVKITGTVTGGIKTAKYIIYRLNGGQRYRIAVTGGTFTINLPKITLGTNTLMLVATDDEFNEWNAYAGFKEVPISIQGELFFKNAGFESATPFEFWTVETHLWGDTSPGTVVPGKSGIVTSGMDPYATSISMVYKGSQAARVNNYDDSYHISSVTQTAVVPNAANPQAKFYWAAVLEQPNHDAANQPYVDVLVTDDTAGSTLYYKHFYTGDESYSGWQTFLVGGYYTWMAIPWQTITLSFSQAQAGHSITAKITAADCGYGAHGGYLYLDGDE
jgi:hypothetical protein